jgi:hypothetical protein
MRTRGPPLQDGVHRKRSCTPKVAAARTVAYVESKALREQLGGSALERSARPRRSRNATTHPSLEGLSGVKPVSLARFLDENGDLTRVAYVDCLAEAVLVDRRQQSPAEQRFLARWCRERVTAWVAGRRNWDEGIGLPENPQFVTALLWQAECLEDPILTRRFKEHLPEELRHKYARRRSVGDDAVAARPEPVAVGR